ncbi:MAG: glycine betaine/L-proline ABC transporter ATP-binding protein [Firmicutes bacterium HGW-Firmicutes-20]|jgi:glycine betaine/proline transport system ATP-binding protein|nr:MAG: glycine betaine/L-proline ABC transporter ATP-binding protein [Firmicutes bacterium HGW-Firmicutes-20]
MMESPVIKVENVSKLFGRNHKEAVEMLNNGATKADVLKETGVTVALWDVNFEVYPGEVFVIIGLSGSGKSTLVRCFNRLNKPTSGSIHYKNQAIEELTQKELISYRRDNIAMVFQNFGLMSHRNVISNVEYGLEVKNVGKELRKQKALEMIKMVGLDGVENAPISSLSGGMKQRVGLARALANEPEVLLMDEPFSALDPLVKKDMQFELLSIQRKLNKTIIFITHDINEAFKLGDRVAIMRDGRVIQIDTPEAMITNPADDYVREFIEGADKSKVMSVRQVMITPSCIVKTSDGANRAIVEMRSNNVSSAYIVNEKMEFKGMLTLDGAIKARDTKGKISEYFSDDVITINTDATIGDAMPLAANAKYPIAILEDNKLKGIITKASLISTLAEN